MESLEHKIGYTFQDRSLLQKALTHYSYSNERHGRVRCNERMEFLGDAVLSIVSAELLYTRFPDMPEGQLSKLRSALVCLPLSAVFLFYRQCNDEQQDSQQDQQQQIISAKPFFSQ